MSSKDHTAALLDHRTGIEMDEHDLERNNWLSTARITPTACNASPMRLGAWRHGTRHAQGLYDGEQVRRSRNERPLSAVKDIITTLRPQLAVARRWRRRKMSMPERTILACPLMESRPCQKNESSSVHFHPR